MAANNSIHFSPILAEVEVLEASEVFTRMKNVREGLSEDQAVSRLAEIGPNIVVVSKHRGWPWRLLTAMRNPLVILLILLATISFATDDVDGGTGMTLTSFMPYTTPSGMFEDVEKHLEMLARGLEELFEFIERVMPGDPPIEAQRLDFLPETWRNLHRTEARLPQGHFQLDALAQQFCAGGIVRFEAFAGADTGRGMVEFDPPRLATLEF